MASRDVKAVVLVSLAVEGFDGLQSATAGHKLIDVSILTLYGPDYDGMKQTIADYAIAEGIKLILLHLPALAARWDGHLVEGD
jgi:hypothetical protein